MTLVLDVLFKNLCICMYNMAVSRNETIYIKSLIYDLTRCCKIKYDKIIKYDKTIKCMTRMYNFKY